MRVHNHCMHAAMLSANDFFILAFEKFKSTTHCSLMLQLKRAHRWLPFLFFSFLLLIGIIIHRDYGISWDEPLQHRLGLATWDFVTGNNNDLLGNDNSYLNPFIALIEVLPEKILQPQSESAMWLSRHLVNFIFCWVGLIFFYLLALRVFQDYRFALLACILFILTPRLVAHSFYNSKDLPFLFLFVVNVYLLVSWLEQPSWSKIVWMAIASGMLTGARIAGILFPVILILALVCAALTRKVNRSHIKAAVIYSLLYPVAVYIFFPTFWYHPIVQFMNAVTVMSHHPYEVTSFFMGETVHSLNTPWYYVPLWMSIIIPIGWWLFFLCGLGALIIMMIRRKKEFPLQWLIIILWLVVPLITQILLHSSTYDDGRHLFFIYPPFFLIATFGLHSLLQNNFEGKKNFRLLFPVAASGIFLTTAIYVISFMIRFHPYQYAYFNAIGRKYAFEYFEKDYWGLSFRNALKFLVRYDKSNQINVSWNIDPCEWNQAWLNNYDRRRIHLDRRAGHYDYFLTNYRSFKPADPSDEKIYELKVQGIPIMVIYKMHPPNSGVTR